MAAARAGVLGVRWLQRAARSVVPLGARTGPRERARPQSGKGMPEGWCVGGRMDVVNTAAAVSVLGGGDGVGMSREAGGGSRWYLHVALASTAADA